MRQPSYNSAAEDAGNKSDKNICGRRVNIPAEFCTGKFKSSRPGDIPSPGDRFSGRFLQVNKGRHCPKIKDLLIRT